jgi:hypothetical protein
MPDLKKAVRGSGYVATMEQLATDRLDAALSRHDADDHAQGGLSSRRRLANCGTHLVVILTRSEVTQRRCSIIACSANPHEGGHSVPERIWLYRTA